jgi:hypothetical protein
MITKWVELSLNQVLVTWNIETHIQHSHQAFNKTQDLSHFACKRSLLSEILPSLPAFEDLLRIAIELPHPATTVAENQSMMRANSLAKMTLQVSTHSNSHKVSIATHNEFTL